MNMRELDAKIAELQAQLAAMSREGVLRPISDEALQVLGLIAADAARAGRIVPMVPTLLDTGETARKFRDEAKIMPGDRLVAVPPIPKFSIVCDSKYLPILEAWGCEVKWRRSGLIEGIKR